LNFDKSDDQKSYIGGACFLEMYDAFCRGKLIYIWNKLAQGSLRDEINGFSPIIINGKVEEIHD
jgi:hypothetical protein